MSESKLRKPRKLSKLGKLQKDIVLLQRCLVERWIPARDGIIAFNLTSCALCVRYHTDDCYNVAEKNQCPIAENTGVLDCKDTPYYACIDNYTRLQLNIKMKLPKLQPEIDFLRDLLKELKATYNDNVDNVDNVDDNEQ